MKTIELSDQDYEFLKELQHELNTQTTDGNAQPVFWGVMETKEEGVPDGCGEPRVYMGDGGTLSLDDAIEYTEEYITDGNREQWERLDKTSMDGFVGFCNDELRWNDVRVVDVERKSSLSETTGAFLTKRACQQYIEKYGYNHSNPQTYAMTAYRNFELERLLTILRTISMI